jgi:hypothetical protein
MYQNCVFLKNYYNTSLYDTTLSDAIVAATSQVQSSNMFAIINCK